MYCIQRVMDAELWFVMPIQSFHPTSNMISFTSHSCLLRDVQHHSAGFASLTCLLHRFRGQHLVMLHYKELSFCSMRASRTLTLCCSSSSNDLSQVPPPSSLLPDPTSRVIFLLLSFFCDCFRTNTASSLQGVQLFWRLVKQVFPKYG